MNAKRQKTCVTMPIIIQDRMTLMHPNLLRKRTIHVWKTINKEDFGPRQSWLSVVELGIIVREKIRWKKIAAACFLPLASLQ